MFVYIDESGIHRPTGYSVFAATFISEACLTEVELGVKTVENEIGIDHFHWAESNWKIKSAFYQGIRKLPFRFFTQIFLNPIKSENCLQDFLRNILDKENVSTVYIDGSKPRWYASSLKKVLQSYGLAVGRIRFLPDHLVAGLRLADFIAGMTRLRADGSRHKDLLEMELGLLKTENPFG